MFLFQVLVQIKCHGSKLWEIVQLGLWFFLIHVRTDVAASVCYHPYTISEQTLIFINYKNEERFFSAVGKDQEGLVLPDTESGLRSRTPINSHFISLVHILLNSSLTPQEKIPVYMYNLLGTMEEHELCSMKRTTVICGESSLIWHVRAIHLLI